MARRIVIGIDEVGRGPLAGPITVATVMGPAISNFQLPISKRSILNGIKDSKKLSAKQRIEWFEKIINPKSKFQIAFASVGAKIIDRIGITHAARIAVGRCLKKLSKNYKLKTINYKLLLDGSLYAPRTYENQETIIKGDEKIPLIAAASIVAKIKRDAMMVRLDGKFPKYGFAAHKGYGTRFHQAAISKHGFSPHHRRSFCSRIV